MKTSIRARSTALLCLLALCMAGAAQADIPSGLLNKDDPSLAPMLQKVMPAVVNVVVKTKTEVHNPLFENPFFRRFFDAPENHNQPRYSKAVGSGVIVDAGKGLIITNNHVVENAKNITVRLNDDREFKGKLIGTDPSSDLAVVQIDADNLTELPVADSSALRVGDFVIAIGNPFGLTQTVTSGIVSGLGRHGLGDRFENFIQTDASINPGNSGGALVDLDGELVGINTAILSRSGGNIGIGFSIPSNLVMKVYHQITEYGEVKRGRLGVVGQNLTNDLAKAFDLDITQGVVVAQVMDDSPAAKAGIQARDVITAVDGQAIKNFSDLARAVGLRTPGTEVKIALIRDGDKQTITLTLGSAAEGSDSAPAGELNKALTGATFGDIPADNPLSGKVKGVAILQVHPASPAARAGLRPGDVITSVNRKKITSVSQFYKLASADTKQLLLHVRRKGGALFLLIK